MAATRAAHTPARTRREALAEWSTVRQWTALAQHFCTSVTWQQQWQQQWVAVAVAAQAAAMAAMLAETTKVANAAQVAATKVAKAAAATV
jgi:hypothetical protein